MQDLISLGNLIRTRQTEQALKRLEPQIKDIRAGYERQIAELEAKLAKAEERADRLASNLAEEQRDNDAHKAEIVELKAQLENSAALAKGTAKRNRGK